MLGILLIYWVGKAFYDLAEKNDRTGWGHAILGVAVYYIVQIVFAAVCFIIIGINSESETAIDDSETMITFLAIPVSALSCWGYYVFLQNRWDKAKELAYTKDANDDLLDDELIMG